MTGRMRVLGFVRVMAGSIMIVLKCDLALTIRVEE